MTLLPGTLLGPYEVLTEIGSGGMGVVYKARDPRLHRDVAIKVIRPSYSQASGRLVQRLEQEARAIAKISHPNILQVYDVGQHDGAPFVVMELLIGETLRERLSKGPIPVRKATDLVIQIANGLAAAHEKGISHRDLKPENVILAPDDQLKILDFGLAKPGPAAGMIGDEATAAFPASELSLTEDGVVMGTAGYLSPEQIRGMGADARSDIFALGVMFYEMLVGSRPFQGSNSVETMAAILRMDVDFPSRNGVDVPPALEHLIRICLEKEPLARFQTARDLSLALQALRTSSGGSFSGNTPILPKRRRRLTSSGMRLVVAILATAAIVIVAIRMLAAAPALGSGQAEWIPLSVRPGLTATARFTADGESVVYSNALGSAPPTLHSLRIGQVLPRPLGMVGQVMAVSADGAILFVHSHQRIHPGAAAKGTLSEFLVDGAEARQLLEQAESADRSRDGRLLAVVRIETGAEGRVNHLECPPGKDLHRTSGWLYCPRISPDASRLAVLESLGPDSWFARVRVLDLQGRTLFLSEAKDILSLAWSPDGKEILYTRNSGIIQAMDLRGRIRTILQGPHQLYLYDVAPDGRLLVASSKDLTEVYLAAEGEPVRTVALNAWAARLSADGSQVLFTGPGPWSGNMTYIQRSGSDAIRPIAAGKLLGASEDGSVVLLKRQGGLYRVPTGPGSEAAVPLGNLGTVWRAALLPDGRRIAVVAAAPGKDFQLHVIDPIDGQQRTLPGSDGIRLLVPIGSEEIVGDALQGGLKRFSLDGRPGVALPGAINGDIPLRLREGGRQLFVQEAQVEPGILRICTVDLRDGQRRLWRTLECPIQPGLRQAQVFSITPDGRKVAYFTWAQPHDLFAVGGLLDLRRGRWWLRWIQP